MKESKRFLKTVIIYVRVYSKEKLNSYSLNIQEEACLDYAKKNGYRVLQVFREENKSAKTFDRPQFKEMVEYIKTNKWKVKFLVVIDSKRLSTDRVGLQKFRCFLKINGIKLISIVQSMLRGVSKQAEKPL